VNPFQSLTAAAFVLAENDIDTDVIFPARFLLHTEKNGLDRFAFHDRPKIRDAFAAAGSPPILIAGANFGCGSSREHAVWALAGLGIRIILAPTFGEIFRGNCTNNGVLAAALSAEHLAAIETNAFALTVDLVARTITCGADTLPIEIPDGDRELLRAGWNTTTRMLARNGEDIAHFEAAQRMSAPWLWTQEPTA
jgi:3-isopropylmalate/(R)-2-methylmalate dehydratase small subunit